MIPDLREAFDSQPGPVVNLGNKTWQITANDTLKFKRSLVGDGDAKILVPTAKDRAIPALVARGQDQHFRGFEMIGQRPEGTSYDKNKEGQHFIRMDGVQGGSVEHCTFRNGWADGVYVDRNTDGVWSRDIEILDCGFEEMGRHHVTPNAVDNCELRGGTMGWSARSLVDVEPGGKGDGARYFRWLDTTITAKGNAGFVFANRGAGTSKTVHHITLDGIRCHNRPFSMTVNPPLDVRRSYFTVKNCLGVGTGITQPQILFRHVDHAVVENVVQPMARGPLVYVSSDCTDIVHDGKKLA